MAKYVKVKKVYKMLHSIGGCGAEPESWADGWDKAIDEVCHNLKDERVIHFLYSENGKGTPGHIRIPEAEKMAEELAAFISGLTIPVWED